MRRSGIETDEHLEREAVKWRRSLFSAFVFAKQGAVRSLRLQRNLRIHWTAGMAVLVWNLCVRPALWLVTLSIITIAVVMSIELINTAIEHLTDLVTEGGYHEFAKWAKDAAAGAVLVSSTGALAVAVLLGAATWKWHFYLFSMHNILGAIESLITLVTLVLWGGISFGMERRNRT